MVLGTVLCGIEAAHQVGVAGMADPNSTSRTDSALSQQVMNQFAEVPAQGITFGHSLAYSGHGHVTHRPCTRILADILPTNYLAAPGTGWACQIQTAT